MKALFKHTSILRPIRPLTDEQLNEAKERIRLRNEKYKREQEIRDQYIFVLRSGVCLICGSTKIGARYDSHGMSAYESYKCHDCKLKVRTGNLLCPK
jgi:hypothetical protein